MQLFQNLIANSLKFCRDTAPQVKITVSQQDSNGDWIIAVQDNGIGIDSKHFERIFAPFQRLHSKKEFEGSGIGLSTCQRIVDQHEGKLSVKSALGQGTTFLITLPNRSRNPGLLEEFRVDSTDHESISRNSVSKSYQGTTSETKRIS